MRILFDILHPAHVHLFRRTIHELEERGHAVLVLAREKDVTCDLLAYYGIRFEAITSAQTGLLRLGRELIERDVKVLKRAWKFHADVLVGTSVPAAHIGKLLGKKGIMFSEDDAKIISLSAKLSYPLAAYVVKPDCLRFEAGKNDVYHASYHELAYLHPDHFVPDEGIFEELGLERGAPYFVIRLSALAAHHDVGARGISEKLLSTLLEKLSCYGRVLVTVEGAVPQYAMTYQCKIPPHRMHDLLAFAALYVGDSQTMAAEAAVLGTPALRCNTFVGRLSYLEELEHKYGLTYGFSPERFEDLLSKVEELLSMADLGEEWQRRRGRMLSEKVNLAGWMVKFLEGL